MHLPLKSIDDIYGNTSADAHSREDNEDNDQADDDEDDDDDVANDDDNARVAYMEMPRRVHKRHKTKPTKGKK